MEKNSSRIADVENLISILAPQEGIESGTPKWRVSYLRYTKAPLVPLGKHKQTSLDQDMQHDRGYGVEQCPAAHRNQELNRVSPSLGSRLDSLTTTFLSHLMES